jgi:hypothetical protein
MTAERQGAALDSLRERRSGGAGASTRSLGDRLRDLLRDMRKGSQGTLFKLGAGKAFARLGDQLQASVAQAEAELRAASGEEVATVVALGLEAYSAQA